MLFIRNEDLVNGKLDPDVRPEPLILRVAAGDWIMVNLTETCATARQHEPTRSSR